MSAPQRLILDLEKNPELAQLVADLEPGSKLDAVFSIVEKDDQKVTVELDEVSDHSGETTTDEAETTDDADAATEGDETPAMKAAKGG